MGIAKKITKMAESLLCKKQRIKEEYYDKRNYLTVANAGWQVSERLYNIVLDMLGSYGFSRIKEAKPLSQFQNTASEVVADAIQKGTCDYTPDEVAEIDWEEWLDEVLYDVQQDPDLYDQYDF